MNSIHVKRDFETLLAVQTSLSKYINSLLLCLNLTFLFSIQWQI